MKTPKDTDLLLNDFALRCFRNTADRDYIHARLAYKSCLIPQFYWSALHCLEKYLKAILLLNRISSKNIKHEISGSLEKLRSQNIFDIELSNQTQKFIDRLEESARFRYLEVSWDIHHIELTILDRAVWEIRRYCQTKICTSSMTFSVDQVQKNLASIRGIDFPTKENTLINGGWLENVLSQKDNPSRPGLIWKNLYFCTSNRKKVNMENFFMAENSPLFINPELIDEVTKYVFLPKEVETAFRTEAINRKNITKRTKP